MKKCLVLLVLPLLAVVPPARAATDCSSGFCFMLNELGDRYELLGDWYLWGDPVDVVIMGDGYREADMAAFEDSVTTLILDFWGYEPYRSKLCSIRFWMVRLVSNDSGIEIPGHATYGSQDTALGTSFATNTKMGIVADSLVCWNAVEAAGVPDPDLICVLVNDPERHDGAWAYPDWRILLMSGAWPWGVILAHELGHLIAGLGDEYPCYVCDAEDGGYLSTPDWNRQFDPATDEPIGFPNLATDLTDLPWEPWEGTRVPTTNFDVYAGWTPGAWEGGGTYRKGVWRSEEYCIMDAVMSPAYEHFCAVCRATLAESLTDCFAHAFSDCTAIAPSNIAQESITGRGPLRRFVEIPHVPEFRRGARVAFRFRYDIPPFWKLAPVDIPGPEPIPVTDIPVRITLEHLPPESIVSVYERDGVVVAQATASDRGFAELVFAADSFRGYQLVVLASTTSAVDNIRIELTVNGIPVPLP